MFDEYQHGMAIIDSRVIHFHHVQSYKPIRHFSFASGITISDTSTTLPNGAKEAWKIPVLIWQLMFCIGSDGECIPNTDDFFRDELGFEDELILNPTEVILQALASAIEVYILLKTHSIWYQESFTLDYLFSVFKFNFLRVLKMGKMFEECKKTPLKKLQKNGGKVWWFPEYKYTQVHEDEKSVLGLHMGEFKRYFFRYFIL